MSELIDRQKAIDAILHITNCKSVRELFEYNQEHHLTEMWSGGVNDAIDAVIGVESATDNNVGTELSTNLAEVGTDCISRQAAISAICNACGKIDCDKMDKCEKLQLPPANCSESPNTSDCISRQQAIRWVKTECNPYGKPTLDFESGKKVIEHLEQMPPAHEPLTDKEQRIFLAAMERERKICKEVDDQYTHEPYEILLTKVCNEIERKVKKALWS